MLTLFLPAQCLTLRMTLAPLKGPPEKTYGCQKNLLFVPPTPEDGVPCLSAPVGGEEPNFHTRHQLTNQVGFTWTNPTFPVLVIFHFLGSTEPLLHPPFSLILPLEHPVSFVQIKVEFCLHWTLFLLQ